MSLHLPGWSRSLITQSDCLEWSRPFAHLASVILYCSPIWGNQTAKFLVVGKSNHSPCLLFQMKVWLNQLNNLIIHYQDLFCGTLNCYYVNLPYDFYLCIPLATHSSLLRCFSIWHAACFKPNPIEVDENSNDFFWIKSRFLIAPTYAFCVDITAVCVTLGKLKPLFFDETTSFSKSPIEMMLCVWSIMLFIGELMPFWTLSPLS